MLFEYFWVKLRLLSNALRRNYDFSNVLGEDQELFKYFVWRHEEVFNLYESFENNYNWKNAKNILFVPKTFKKNVYFWRKNRKLFDFGQNLRKESMLYLKHFRSIEFLPITFEKYQILDQYTESLNNPPPSSEIFP